MMDTKENYFAYLNHEKTDFVPNILTDVCFCGGPHEIFENGPVGGGEDGFGCRWLATESAGGQGVPDVSHIVLRDITAWEDVVRFPDLDAFDWQALADRQLAGNRDRSKFVEYTSWNSQFLRLTHLMGFEEGMCALYEEPEACDTLLTAITDYKIRLLEYAHKYFKPDSFVNFDDVATERGLFISPKLYREHIKPQHKRMNDAAKAYGMIPQQHCCGCCQDIIPDFIDEGSAAWQAAQPSNDIAAIIQQYGDRIGVTGGYDTQGRPGQSTVTDEEIVAEVDRCMAEYAKFGKSYCFMGLFIGNTGDPTLGGKFATMVSRANKDRAF